MIPPNTSGYNDRLAHEAAVELSPEQAAALKALCMDLQATFDQAKKNAKRAGSSILMSLARGDLTIDRLNEHEVEKARDVKEWEEED